MQNKYMVRNVYKTSAMTARDSGNVLNPLSSGPCVATELNDNISSPVMARSGPCADWQLNTMGCPCPLPKMLGKMLATDKYHSCSSSPRPVSPLAALVTAAAKNSERINLVP